MHSFLYVLFIVVSHRRLAVALCCTVGPCGLSLLYMEVSSADPASHASPLRRLLWGPPACCLGEGNGTHSSTLAWKIPRTEEPGGPQSMGSLRVGHD